MTGRARLFVLAAFASWVLSGSALASYVYLGTTSASGASGSTGTIYSVSPSGVASVVASGAAFGYSHGMAIDSSGNLYVSNIVAGTISEISASSGMVSTFASGLANPAGLAFDSAGNLYVANLGNSTIGQYTPAQVYSVFASGGSLNQPMGIAFDSSGNLYAADRGGNSNSVSKITPGGSVSLYGTFTGSSDDIAGVAVDGSGNLYASSNNISGAIYEITASHVVFVFAAGSYLAGPEALAFDNTGAFYAADEYGSVINTVATNGSGAHSAAYSGVFNIDTMLISGAGPSGGTQVSPEPSCLAIFGLVCVAPLARRRRRPEKHPFTE